MKGKRLENGENGETSRNPNTLPLHVLSLAMQLERGRWVHLVPFRWLVNPSPSPNPIFPTSQPPLKTPPLHSPFGRAERHF